MSIQTARGYTITPFTIGDVDALTLRVEDAAFWAALDLRAYLQAFVPYPSRTLWYHDEAVVCYGMVMPWRGLGAVWSVFHRNAFAHRYAIWRRLCTDLEYMIWKEQLRRVEVLTVAGDAAADRVLHHLGFHVVVQKPQFGPRGETFFEWAWVQE